MIQIKVSIVSLILEKEHKFDCVSKNLNPIRACAQELPLKALGNSTG